MTTITIDIEKPKMIADAESLLWKYGVMTEGAGVKQSNNVKSDSGSRTVDGRLLATAMTKRSAKAADIMHDFDATVTETNNSATPPVAVIRFTVSVSLRWLGTQTTLKEALEKYILDGMMTDYLNVTAPSEVQMYSSQLQDDVNAIKKIIYSLGKPAVS